MVLIGAVSLLSGGGVSVTQSDLQHCLITTLAPLRSALLHHSLLLPLRLRLMQTSPLKFIGFFAHMKRSPGKVRNMTKHSTSELSVTHTYI